MTNDEFRMSKEGGPNANPFDIRHSTFAIAHVLAHQSLTEHLRAAPGLPNAHPALGLSPRASSCPLRSLLTTARASWEPRADCPAGATAAGPTPGLISCQRQELHKVLVVEARWAGSPVTEALFGRNAASGSPRRDP